MKLSDRVRAVIDYFWIFVGSALIALALDWFLIPNKIAAGGVSGIATIIHYLFGLPVGAVMIALNVPLFLMGFKELGLKFGVRSLYGMLVLSLLVDFLAPYLKALTKDPFLACLYGGVLSGIGLGIVFKFKGSTGGTDLAAAILRRFTKTNVGMALLFIDGLVVFASGIVFNPEQALYALITIVVTSLLIDLVQEGMGYARAFFIISDKNDLISEKIITELDRGGTCLKGEGIYSRKEKNVLLAVVNRSEVSRLKEIVYQIDPKAFVIVTNVHEVLGEGFKPMVKEGN